MRLLLFGGTGQVGEEFRRLALPAGVEMAAPGRNAVDLCDGEAVARTVAAERWSAVINAAAYTDVDRAESEEAMAFAVNAEAPARLAAATARQGIPLIQISTDYVFDGRKGAPYVEDDAVGPLNIYGHSKLAGERAVAAGNPRHVILRTSWLYSPYRKNFVRTMLRLMAERDRLTVVADQRGCPTAAADVAKACRDVALHCAADPERAPYGIFHFAGLGEASWHEFAAEIAKLAAERLGRSPQVVPIRTVDYPTPARRPADTRLDCARIAHRYGIKPRPWRQALDDTMNRLFACEPST